MTTDKNACLWAANQCIGLRWSLGALFRLQKGGFATALERLDGPAAFQAMIEVFWAALPQDACQTLRVHYGEDSPDALVRALDEGAMGKAQSLGELRDQLFLLFKSAELTAEKKSVSTQSPTPELSSD